MSELLESLFHAPYVRPAAVEDCAELAVTLREADRMEIALGGSPSPYDALMRGFAFSDEPLAVVGRHDEVIALFGVVALAPGLGGPWMLASDGLADIRLPFLRECRAYVAAMHERFALLYNQVWEGNALHIRWLRWLGFTVNPAPIHQPHFLPFWKNHVHTSNTGGGAANHVGGLHRGGRGLSGVRRQGHPCAGQGIGRRCPPAG